VALHTLAPAKVNLYLHVVGRRDDGYHLLDSLVVFADIGDWVTAAPAPELSLAVAGPEAMALEATGEDNLVIRAARLMRVDMAAGGAALTLQKCLPVSSGIGGGSSDAAAALRLLDRLWRRPLDPDALAVLALQLGADVPACLAARPVWVGGIGEALTPADGLPDAGIVLANPRRPLSTPAVFRARQGQFSAAARFAPMPRDAAGLAALLAERRNDLTAAAASLVPEIDRMLAVLAALPGALLARMSGSGASCFALFADRAGAVAAQRRLAAAEPGWWSMAGALLQTPPAIAEAPPQPEG